jgi:crossover junction endodeoxyribonuclease RuvC
MIRVLAFDPGYDRLGVGVLEGTAHSPSLLHSSCITTDRVLALPDRLKIIGESVENLILRFKPQLVAVETLFFNKNQKTALGVAEVRGIIIYLARHHEIKLVEFSPQEIKIAVTGYGKSDKQSVFSMLERLLPACPKGALDDEYDALAIAMTALAHSREVGR